MIRVRNSLLRREGADCAVEPKWADWDKGKGETVFAYFCGFRQSDGKGYVGVFWMAKKGDTLVRVSEEWRGERYEFGNSQTYFWERRALTDLIARMGNGELRD